MEECVRDNIELKTILRAMKNINEITTFSLWMVAMVQKEKIEKNLEYWLFALYIPTNMKNAHLVAKIRKNNYMDIKRTITWL